MPSAKVHIHNIDAFISKLKSIGGGAPQYLDAVMERCMRNDLWPLWVKQISMHDHTLQALAQLGHPYSTRYGKDSFVHPDDVVHIQDGNLLGGSYIEHGAGSGGQVVWQLRNDAEEYVYLRYGTATMRMRDPGGEAMREALGPIRRRFRNEVKDAIVKFFAR